MTTQEAFVYSIDQEQTAQNVQSDLWSTLSLFFIIDYNYTVSSSCNGTVFLANEKAWFIYSVVKELINSVPDDKILDLSTLKAFVDTKINVTQILKFIFRG